jgi:hypothetical protein
MSDSVVACTLTDSALRERRSGVLARLSTAVLERSELPDGFAFRFEPSSATVALLAEVIDLERQCCAFPRFRLTVEPEQGPVWLELTGPEGSKALLSDLLAE